VLGSLDFSFVSERSCRAKAIRPSPHLGKGLFHYIFGRLPIANDL
jgi:hypothetical protein